VSDAKPFGVRFFLKSGLRMGGRYRNRYIWPSFDNRCYPKMQF
jgi:hypothetical protein